MKRYLIVLSLTALVSSILYIAFVLYSISNETEEAYDLLKQNMRWSYEKSPLSGRCYEFMYTYIGRNNIVDMNEVPCREVERNKQ